MSKNLVEILDGYKVGELKELAKTSGLKGYSKLKKAELVEAVSKQLEQVEVASLDVPDEIKNIFVKEEKKEKAVQKKDYSYEDSYHRCCASCYERCKRWSGSICSGCQSGFA